MLSKSACVTRHWQTSRRLVKELNVCTVGYADDMWWWLFLNCQVAKCTHETFAGVSFLSPFRKMGFEISLQCVYSSFVVMKIAVFICLLFLFHVLYSGICTIASLQDTSVPKWQIQATLLNPDWCGPSMSVRD